MNDHIADAVPLGCKHRLPDWARDLCVVLHCDVTEINCRRASWKWMESAYAIVVVVVVVAKLYCCDVKGMSLEENPSLL